MLSHSHVENSWPPAGISTGRLGVASSRPSLSRPSSLSVATPMHVPQRYTVPHHVPQFLVLRACVHSVRRSIMGAFPTPLEIVHVYRQ